ncbi:hypothetical protein ABI57_21710 [Salmonella enterica subsp. enterica serovar Veneziana]|nr:hypothetical protein ABI57_21710 [Salmonella enterica subsp. enterica serovar Veneziana]
MSDTREPEYEKGHANAQPVNVINLNVNIAFTSVLLKVIFEVPIIVGDRYIGVYIFPALCSGLFFARKKAHRSEPLCFPGAWLLRCRVPPGEPLAGQTVARITPIYQQDKLTI